MLTSNTEGTFQRMEDSYINIKEGESLIKTSIQAQWQIIYWFVEEE